ncbi:MAG: NTP transferase domain-containing protein [Anaerolineales bacterium]
MNCPCPGGPYRFEDGTPHLNIAITRATAVASMYNAAGVLILPADLPQMVPEDVTKMVEAASSYPSVVIAPDHRRQGTNALLVKPAGLLKYSFGENSFQRHVAQAEEKGAKVSVIELPSLARDVDYPDDLAFLNGQLEEWTRPEEPEKDNEQYAGYYSEMISNGSVGSES